jgi:hypothetical protein
MDNARFVYKICNYTRGMLENFDPNTIEDETARKVVLYLMNLVENQHITIQEQAEEIQRLRDEVNRRKRRTGQAEGKNELQKRNGVSPNRTTKRANSRRSR